MKKKYLIVMILMLISMSVSAQTSKIKKFFGGFNYEILLGFGSTLSNEPFKETILGYNLGLTVRKDIKSFTGDRLDVYGLTGLILTKRGGKYNDDIMSLVENRFTTSNLVVPIHIGGEYNFKKSSLFVDFGPYVLINTSSSDMENISTNPVAFGAGFNFGIRFKRFALSFGVDQDISSLAKFSPSYNQREDLELDKDKYELKTGEAHINLRWTLGKIDK